MKKVIYKNLKGNNPRKSEISIEESHDWTEVRNGGINKARMLKKKICKYFIKDRYSSQDPEELKSWIEKNKSKGELKNSHIIRKVNTETGENKIVCKVLGVIFVISQDTAYKVVYVNELKVEIGDCAKNIRGIDNE